ncbi:MAG: hypothetical protein IPM16_16565 [Chloroflexi bacterium]|nr:hypothetical protein [Chloroflexota bacterium]
MGRVVNTDNPGKRRSALMRTVAELLRQLVLQPAINDDAKDMVAQMVFCLREIDEGIDESARAWEKRGYWMKSEEFRSNWMWVSNAAQDLARVAAAEDWPQLAPMLIRLMPKFSDINITKFTRDSSVWTGAYARLLKEQR